MTMFQRSSQIWSLLVCAARKRKTYTYGEISGIIGVASVGIGKFLGPITLYCKVNDLRLLTVLAVNADTGVPLGHYYNDIEDMNRYREEVFQFGWFEIEPPQISDFEAVYKSHSHLLKE